MAAVWNVVKMFFGATYVTLCAAGVIIGIVCVIKMTIEDKRNVKKVIATKAALNELLENTGSPARYDTCYSDWKWALSYDESPEENAIAHMEHAIELYNEYLKGGGDPNFIEDVDQLFDMERQTWLQSIEN